MTFLGMSAVIVPLLALIGLAWRGLPILLLAPLAAAAAAALASENVFSAITATFMEATSRFVRDFFLLFLLGAVFGRIMRDTGAADAVAGWIVRRLGAGRAILAIVLACAVLTYGGVSLFVVAFAVYPLALSLFASADIPRRMIPATIALGAFTFTMTALPGTPAVQNAIPIPVFGTSLYAAPWLGLVAAAIMALGGVGWLEHRARRLRRAGEGFAPRSTHHDAGHPAPAVARAALPLVLVLATNALLVYGLFPLSGLGAAPASGVWAIILALTLASCAALATMPLPAGSLRPTLNGGAETALLPLFNTAALVGFGAVVASLPGFAAIEAAVLAIPGGPLVSLAAAAAILAGITGSASGGMTIALDALGETYLAEAEAEGIPPAQLHRVTALATGGLDALPHNGAVVTLLGIGKLKHAEAYGNIFVVAVAIPVVALLAVLGLASL
ncbi:MAG: GntP family permease [Pseudomonadota bacterium]